MYTFHCVASTTEKKEVNCICSTTSLVMTSHHRLFLHESKHFQQEIVDFLKRDILNGGGVGRKLLCYSILSIRVWALFSFSFVVLSVFLKLYRNYAGS